jgi:hypothetical protein
MFSKVMGTALSSALAMFYAGGFSTNATQFNDLPSTSGCASTDETCRVRVETNTHNVGGKDTCEWYHVAQRNDTDTNCDTFSVRRGLSGQTSSLFRDRAEQCALKYGVTCVLSHEVGIDVPAYMYLQGTTSVVVILPYIQLVDVEAKPTTRVRHVDPHDSSLERVILDMHEEVKLSYVEATTRQEIDRIAVGFESYCAQMLARSVPDSCAVSSF